MNMLSGPPVKALMSPEVAGSIWKENVKIADENNHPGKFTAFCSYEYTSAPDNRNLHRNIFFRDCAHVPVMPYSALDSWHPEDLWKWMDAQRKAGNELLAISHNANLSDGWMYPIDVDSFGRPIDAAWAASRDRNERLVEIKQIKGQSETHPLLSPNDEFASYELFTGLLGAPPTVGRVDHIQGSFAPPGPERRHHHAGRARLQPLQVRHGWRLGFPQHRQSLPPGQFLRRSRSDRRNRRPAHGRGYGVWHH